MDYNNYTSIYSDEFDYDADLESTYNSYLRDNTVLSYDDIINTDDLVY